MSDSDRGNPIQAGLVILLLVGGGWYFFRHYDIRGLDHVSVRPKTDDAATAAAPASPFSAIDRSTPGTAEVEASPTAAGATAIVPGPAPSADAAADVDDLRIASWALDGLGPTKLARPETRKRLVEVIRRFDLVAVQQVADLARDTIPGLVEAVNAGDARYDFVVGPPTGPRDRPERLAFLFDTARLEVDRTQTYSVADPADELTYDPLVAWFRAAEPPDREAWTFTVVNVRIDRAEAAEELRWLAGLLQAVRGDGRGEDDVVLAGLFQADASYLLPTMAGEAIGVAVERQPTEVRGRHQACNLLVDRHRTTEFLGRGGTFDFLRAFNLDIVEAEAVTRHLPVFGEFTARELGNL